MAPPKLRIPRAVEASLIARRREKLEENARWDGEFERRRAEDPQHVVFRHPARPLVLDIELQFWLHAEDEELEEFLFEELLEAMSPTLWDGNWSALPPGYKPLLDVLEFERHYDFETWGAISNEGSEQMRNIIAGYHFLGLKAEALALEAVLDAYHQLPDDDAPGVTETLERVYRSKRRKSRWDFDRMLPIIRFVRRKPALFSE